MVTKVVGKQEILQYFRYVVSAYLSRYALPPPVDPLVCRAQFGNVPCKSLKAVSDHTHGEAAANRSTGSFIIDLVSRSLGCVPIFYQCSASDQRNGRMGSRSFYWSKDLNVISSPFMVKPRNVIAMVDVDQYVDMNDFMSRHFNPCLIYTFQPGSVSKSDGEYSYTFNRNSEVTYLVSGGGCYKHPVWNYAGDSLMCSRKVMGFTYDLSVFQVERRQMDMDHQLILLAPLKRFVGLPAFVASMFISGSCFQRLVLNVGNYLRLRVQTKEGLTTHTGIVENYAKAVVPTIIDDELSSITRTSKVGLSLPMVKKKMGDTVEGAEILYEFHKMNTVSLVPQVSYHLDPYVRSFQWIDDNEDYDHEAKPSMVSFMKPLVDGAFCPDRSLGNDKRSVRKRVEEQKNTTTVTPHIMKLVEEFWDLLLLEENSQLHPVDEDYLFEKQCRPTQKRILNEAEYLDGNNLVKSFVKREAYTKLNDPRMISTINGASKRDYAMFVYALSMVIKTQCWYAFSKNPKQIAERVAEICSTASFVTKSDSVKMDGRWSEVARYFERRGMMKAFRPMYHDELNELLDRIVNCKGFTIHGVVYETALTKLSGEPGTSDMNTAFNCFMVYATFRAMRAGYGYVTMHEAWDRLGVYGGDDGLTADIPSNLYVKTAFKMGQILEAEPVKRGENGVEFLARQYGPDVWFGDLSSCCCFVRTLSKFHVTVHMPNNVTAQSKLFDKAYAAWLMDKNTPVLGPFVCKVLELLPYRKFTNLTNVWRNSFEESVQYPNEYGEWMMERFIEELPNFNLERFNQWIVTATACTIMEPPLFMDKLEPTSKAGDVVIENEIIITPEPKTTKENLTISPRTRSRVRQRTGPRTVVFRKKT